jgi:hypothetical protein
MIEVEREERSAKGRWRWFVRGRPQIKGISRQPLCSTPAARCKRWASPLTGLYPYPGRTTEWDLRTTIAYCASKTVADEAGRYLRDFRPFGGPLAARRARA